MELEKLWVPAKVGMDFLGYGKSKLYDDIRKGKIEARRLDGKLMLSVPGLQKRIAEMPPAKIRGNKAA